MFGFDFVIEGTPAISGSAFALGAVTPKNRTTKQVLQAAGFTGKTPGQLVVNATRANSRSMILSVAGDIATLMQPLSPLVPGVDTTYFPLPTENDAWAPGDSVQVYDLPLLNLVDVEFHGPVGESTFSKAAAAWIQNIHIPDISGVPGSSTFCPEYEGGELVIDNVWIEAYGLSQPNTFVTTSANTWWSAGGQFQYTNFVGGAVSGFGAQFEHENWIDGDFILDGGSASTGLLYTSFMCLSAAGQLIMHPGSSVEIRDLGLAPVSGGVMWGPGMLALQANSACVRRLPTPSWAACLNVTTLHFPSSATVGTSYASGVWTDGRALTPANLDTYHGLQDPKTGARFSEDL